MELTRRGRVIVHGVRKSVELALLAALGTLSLYMSFGGNASSAILIVPWWGAVCLLWVLYGLRLYWEWQQLGNYSEVSRTWVIRVRTMLRLCLLAVIVAALVCLGGQLASLLANKHHRFFPFALIGVLEAILLVRFWRQRQSLREHDNSCFASEMLDVGVMSHDKQESLSCLKGSHVLHMLEMWVLGVFAVLTIVDTTFKGVSLVTAVVVVPFVLLWLQLTICYGWRYAYERTIIQGFPPPDEPVGRLRRIWCGWDQVSQLGFVVTAIVGSVCAVGMSCYLILAHFSPTHVVYAIGDWLLLHFFLVRLGQVRGDNIDLSHFVQQPMQLDPMPQDYLRDVNSVFDDFEASQAGSAYTSMMGDDDDDDDDDFY